MAEQGNSLTAGKKKVSFMNVRNFAEYMRWFISRLNLSKVETTKNRLIRSAEARRKMAELHKSLLNFESEVFNKVLNRYRNVNASSAIL